MPSSKYYVTNHTVLTTNVTKPFLYEFIFHRIKSIVIMP